MKRAERTSESDEQRDCKGERLHVFDSVTKAAASELARHNQVTSRFLFFFFFDKMAVK